MEQQTDLPELRSPRACWMSAFSLSRAHPTHPIKALVGRAFPFCSLEEPGHQALLVASKSFFPSTAQGLPEFSTSFPRIYLIMTGGDVAFSTA